MVNMVSLSICTSCFDFFFLRGGGVQGVWGEVVPL